MSPRARWLDLRRDPPPHLRFGPLGARVALLHGLIYLATPYSREVVGHGGAWCAARNRRAMHVAADECARLAAVGITAISPIVQAAAMVRVRSGEPAAGCVPRLDPLDQQFWTQWCRPLLVACDAVVIPPIAGWQDSDGVLLEAEWALGRNRPVHVIAEVV